MMEPDLIEQLFTKGVLVHRDFLSKTPDEPLLERLEAEADLLVLNSDYAEVLSQSTALVDWYELDGCRVQAERNRDDELYQSHLQECKSSFLRLAPLAENQTLSALEIQLESNLAQNSTMSHFQGTPADSMLEPTTDLSLAPVKVLISFQNIPKSYEVKDFTSLFLSRYHFMEKLLRGRPELQNALPLSRLAAKTERETVSFIGMVTEKVETKSGNLMITLEDLTGQIKTLVTKAKTSLFKEARDLVPDEVVGISGMLGDKILFTENIFWPDLPVRSELKKSPEGEDYAVFLSDLHVGSALFLKEEFRRFLQWIKGEAGSPEQREIARRAKYVFIVGDLVDGIGVYPAQEPELEIKDITGQYREFTRLVKEIPSNKQIIICPGNHDAVHLAEPQPALYQEYVPELAGRPNITLVTNPAMVTIGKTKTFPGFDVLLYHGYGFDYYVANVESIRNGGGYQRADLIMKYLLKRRHLAPAFKSTPYFPGHAEDPLLIRKIPDFFVTGHIHYSSVANYRGVTMISCSCWQGKTSFQEKLGHKPEPARLPLVNLKTREIKVLRFG